MYKAGLHPKASYQHLQLPKPPLPGSMAAASLNLLVCKLQNLAIKPFGSKRLYLPKIYLFGLRILLSSRQFFKKEYNKSSPSPPVCLKARHIFVEVSLLSARMERSSSETRLDSHQHGNGTRGVHTTNLLTSSHLPFLMLFSRSVVSDSLWSQASPSFTISRSLLKLMSIKSLMPSNHLIPCHNPSVWSFAIFMNTQGKRGGWNE